MNADFRNSMECWLWQREWKPIKENLRLPSIDVRIAELFSSPENKEYLIHLAKRYPTHYWKSGSVPLAEGRVTEVDRTQAVERVAAQTRVVSKQEAVPADRDKRHLLEEDVLRLPKQG